MGDSGNPDQATAKQRYWMDMLLRAGPQAARTVGDRLCWQAEGAPGHPASVISVSVVAPTRQNRGALG